MSKFKAVSIDAVFGLMERRVRGTMLVRRDRASDGDAQDNAAHSAVIPREGGESSTPRHLDSITAATEYWIARSSRATTARVWKVRTQARHCERSDLSAEAFGEGGSNPGIHLRK
ncbi:hypothetical protein [Bradyrhizobium nanningense]|uniref:hypothetical protein n=1 Tax=Bradyrhizobium nanningense TaxID=1325118 RepID=UPI0010090C75|nr:hypothetical protein [Bradyrhizobium nanningense]